MLWIFQKISERLKTLLAADAHFELEAEFLSRHAERKAELLQKANEYEQQGLDEVAAELRQQSLALIVGQRLNGSGDVTALGSETIETQTARITDESKLSAGRSHPNGKSSPNSKHQSTRKLKKR